MPEKHYKLRLPKLITQGDPTSVQYSFARSHMLDGTIPVYFGPKQPFVTRDPTDTSENPIYQPPQDWPKAGTVLGVPRVVRFFWQTADLDAEAVTIAGFSGVYTYGLHIASTSISDIYTGGGIYPGIVNVTYPWPQFTQGIVCYATQRTITGAGEQTINGPGGGEFIFSSEVVDFFLWSFETNPYSMVDYRAPAGLTYPIIYTAWLLLLNGFTPNVHEDPGNDQTVPQYITDTYSGFFNVGCTKPIRTGYYSVDGQLLFTPPDQEIPADAVIVPIGFDRGLSVIDITIQPTNWTTVSDGINTKYQSNANYWVYAQEIPEYTWGWLDAISPEKTTYFAGDSLTIIILSKPQDMPSDGDWRVQRIKAAYPHMVGYNVVFFADVGYMTDCNLADVVISAFTDALTSWCSGLNNYGITYGGAVDYKTAPQAMPPQVDSLINQYMPLPDPNDSQNNF